MGSLMTPPLSSPNQSAYKQPAAVKRPTQQPEDGYHEPDGPIPKRRRQGPCAVDGLEVVSLLSDDDTKGDGDGDGQVRPPAIPEPSLGWPERLPPSLSSSHFRGMATAKALSSAAVDREIPGPRPSHVAPALNQAIPPAQWSPQHWQPPAPLTPSLYYYGQNERDRPRPRPRNGPVPMPPQYEIHERSTVPIYPSLPAWNHALPHNESGTAAHFDTPPTPKPPGHQDHTPVPSQAQPWPHQQWHGYNRHGPPRTNFAYAPQPSHMPPTTGTASCPIVLDAPMQNVPAPVYAPSQPAAYGLASNPIPLYDTPRQGTIYDNYAPWPQPVAQSSAVTATQQAPNVAKQPAQQQTTKPDAAAPICEPVLCPEQEELVSLIQSGKNVFYTGSAGCGKSTVLKAFVKRLQDQQKRVRIVAPTGRAALNVGGSTTWTFAGWTPDSHKLPREKLVQGAHGTHVHERLTDLDVLVIDEISMVENHHFERLNILMKTARHNPKLRVQPAFGGCQIVVTGDFCQLPPVKPFQHCIECGREMAQRTGQGGKLVHRCMQHGENLNEDKWAFRSKAWQECGFEHVHLKKIHRQNDETFIKMLQKCRLGSKLSDAEIKVLMHHRCRTAQATKLFSTRKEAKAVNRDKFEKLAGIKLAYWCHDSFFWNALHPHLQWKNRTGEWGDASATAQPPATKKPLHALEDHRWEKCVQLKQGMLVVLLTNLDLEAGLCNGSQGLIKGFEEYDPKMLPVRETFDARGRKKVEAQPGQRVVRGEHAAVQEGEIKNFIAGESAPVKKWPVVRFHNGVVRTVYAECSIAQLGDDEPYCLLARTQIPLAPAWAMTIHKSQSLTLDRVIVNLSRAFEEGQVYVALSRATGLEGLKIEGDGGFLRSKLMVNPEVAAFLKEKFGDIYGVNAEEDVVTVSD